MLYVISIGAFQALIAVLLLWKNKFRNKADALLVVLLCCIATHLGIKFYIYSFVEDLQIRTQMNTFIGFCYGPLAYLYVLKLLDDKFIPATRMYLFIPFVLAAIGYLTVFCLLLADVPVGHRALQVYNDTSTWLFMASGAFYPLIIFRKLRLIQAKGERQLVLHISVLMLAVAVTGAIFKTISLFTGPSMESMLLCRNICYILLSVICIEILRFKYAGIPGARTPAPAPILLLPDIEEVTEAEIPVPKKIQLAETEHKKILQKLDQHLAATKLYLDPDLSLDKLSAAIGESKYHVSEALNVYAGKPFYQYINEYRISCALEIMTAIYQKNLPVNILMIAFECGFKAKSSFNNYFKKITGETPSAYLSRLKTGAAAAC
ncbi:helix-turn-helix domain-containing protein [Chitinophaga barathri]|uniref:AraC family transcriptional regulator n=1 Tax=Chitinophaga barathri TaxID=1647451 RepID=A0A3N4M5P3_9BACT|nr:helix-turn-helix transcriptional regulator [Chitinophaga barathri]RPD38325.1 AraC family transcriptional regulator [Chitinophaga barathri]